MNLRILLIFPCCFLLTVLVRAEDDTSTTVVDDTLTTVLDDIATTVSSDTTNEAEQEIKFVNNNEADTSPKPESEAEPENKPTEAEVKPEAETTSHPAQDGETTQNEVHVDNNNEITLKTMSGGSDQQVEDKSKIEEKVSQINKEDQENQEVNFVFPSNNPNKEDEFERMARLMTTSKDLDAALEKKLAADWSEHLDHNKENEEPNFVFDNKEEKEAFKIQPETELLDEDKKTEPTKKADKDIDIRLALPKTDTEAEKVKDVGKADSEVKSDDEKEKSEGTTNKIKPEKSMVMNESEENIEESITEKSTTLTSSEETVKQKESSLQSKKEDNTNIPDKKESVDTKENDFALKEKEMTAKQKAIIPESKEDVSSTEKTITTVKTQKDISHENLKEEKKVKKPTSNPGAHKEKTMNGYELQALPESKKESPDVLREDKKPSSEDNKKHIQNENPISGEKQSASKLSENKIKKTSPEKEKTISEDKHTKLAETSHSEEVSGDKIKKPSSEEKEKHIVKEKTKDVSGENKIKKPTPEKQDKHVEKGKTINRDKELTGSINEASGEKMKTPHEFKTKEKSDSKPRKEVKDSASQTAKEIGVKSHSKEVTDDKKPIDKAPESHAKKLATQKELKLNKADETLTEEQLIKNALKFDKLQPSTQEPPAPKILSVNPIDKTASNQTQQEDDGTNVNTTLVFAEIVLRHGDRYKGYDDDETYPYDPYSQEDPFWLPYGCDQLRNKGKMRSYWLGLFMRKRYNGFLKDEYYHNDVRLTSADLDRCIDSAHVMTAGLYPPKGINIWNDNVGRYYQPIPVRTLDAENDIYLNEDVHCVPYEMELAKVLLQGMKNFNLKYKYVYEYLEMYTGMSVSNLMDVARIYTTLRIENENGRKLPEWVSLVFPDKLKTLNSYYNQIRTSSDYFKRIQAGPFLTLILDDLKLKSQNRLRPNHKIKFWSGFDTTILKLLYTMKETQPSLDKAEELLETDYNGALMIELHLIKNEYYIKVLYVNMDSLFMKTRAPRPVKICDGLTLCPLENFLERMDKYRITEEEWYKQCNITYCDSTQPDNSIKLRKI
ncbi:hypothetical protein M8J75_016194 [Diaphorina citri]|nr:hypothetical protein M8J75_016194 [Diaphorina citri]